MTTMEDPKDVTLNLPDGAAHDSSAGVPTVNLPNLDVAEFSPLKPATIAKPEFGPFIDELRELLSNENHNSVSNVLKFIRKGYKGAKLPQRTQELFDTMVNWSSFSEMAVDLCLPSGPMQKIEILRLLGPHLQAYAQHKTDYPGSTNDRPRPKQLEEWVTEKLTNAVPVADSHDRLELQRFMFVCLAGEGSANSVPAIYHLLQLVADHHIDYGTREGVQASLAELATHLQQSGKQKSKLNGAIRFAGAALHLNQLLGEAAASSERANRRLENDRGLLENQLSATHARTLELTDQCHELEQQCATLAADLATQIHERQLDEDHSRQIAHQQLVKIVDEIIRRVTHDLSETTICLEQDPPNIAMAIERLARTTTWISKRRPT
jgi:hypothetical protein